MNDNLLSIQAVADILRVSTKTLRRWDKAGKFVAKRTAGGQRRYTKEQIERFQQSKDANQSYQPTLPPSLRFEQGVESHPDPSADREGLRDSSSRHVGVQNDKKRVNPLGVSLLVGSFCLLVLLLDLNVLVRNGAMNLLSDSLILSTLDKISPGLAKNIRSFAPQRLGFGGTQDDKNIGHSEYFAQDLNKGSVLGESTEKNSLLFNVNIPSSFNESVEFIKGLHALEIATLSGGLITENQDVNAGTGKLTASNVLYGAKAGSGISVSSGQTPTITNTGVLSLQSKTGAVSLSSGTGISLSGLTITNSGVTSLAGTSNQVTVSGSTGGVTLSLPQSIGTGSSPTFSGLTLSSFTSNGGPLYTNGSGALAQATAGSSSQCLLGGTTPSFGTCTGGSNWTLDTTNGVLRPNNNTVDLLIGGTATSSAKFAVLNVNSGTPTASVSAGTAGGAYLTAAGSLQTTANQGLTIGGSTTGDITLSPRNGSGTLALSLGSLTVNSSTGSTIVSATCVTTTNGIVTGSGNCGAGSGGSVWVLASATGVLYPINNTVDLLIGGTATTSARFAALNINSGTPTASVSAGSSGASIHTAAGLIATTARQTLTLGDTNTGEVQLVPSGTLALTARGANLIGAGTLTGLTGLTSSGTITFSGLSTNGPVYTTTGGVLNSEAQLALGRGGTNANLTAAAGAVAYSTSTALALTAAGTSGQCLTSAGTGTPVWIGCALGNATNFWTSTNGALYPINSTLDLLIGATASTSAKFAVLNVNSGTPTATISANSGNNATTLTGLGVLGTTNAQTLTLGNSSTGEVVIAPGGTRVFAARAQVLDFTTAAVGFNFLSSSATALRVNDGSGNTFFTFDTRLGTSGASAFLFSPPNTGAITSAATADYTTLDVTPPVIQLSGGTQVTSIMDSTIFRQPTIGDSTAITVNDADNVTIGGGVISSSTASVTITNSSALRITAGSSLDSGTGTVTNGYGLYVDAPTGAVNNYAATFATGAVGIGATSPLATLDVRGNSGTTPVASVSGTTSFASLLANNDGVGDIFTASKSGAPKFTILNNGNISWAGTTNFLNTLATAATAARTITFPDATGTLCLQASSSCGFAMGSTTNWWNSTNGAVYPINSTLDLLIGGTASTSAKFAVLNVNSGTPTASVSAGTAGAALLTATGTLATTAKQTLALGDTNTGEVQLTPGGTLALTARSNNLIGAGTLTGLTGLTSSGTITFSGFTTDKGILYTNGSGVLSQTAQGASNTLLHGNGASAPTFSAVNLATDVSGILPTANGGSFWNSSSGALYPGNSTLDLLIGATSTASAKFGFLNVAGGTPTASISANSGNNATFLTGLGNLATTNKQTLTLGGSSTGIINVLGNAGTAFTTFDTVNSRVGIGTVSPATTLEVTGGSPELRVSGSAGSIDFNAAGSTTSINSTVLLRLNPTDNQAITTGTGLTTLGGNLTVNGATTTFGNASPTITTGTNTTLTVTPNGSGSLILTSDFDTGVLVGSSSNTISPLSVSGGIGSNAAFILNQTNSGDILTASASGTTKFTVNNNGNLQFAGSTSFLTTLTSAATAARTITFPDATGTLCLQASSSCGFAMGSTTNWWNSTNGAVYPINSTLDLLIGATASTSAKFAVLNVNSGTPTASVSAGTAGGAYLTAAGSLQTTANQGLTIGGSTTGDITLSPRNGSGTLALSLGSLTVNSSTGSTIVSATCVTTTNGIVTGSGNCGAGSGGSVWVLASATGVLYPINNTVDLLIGGTATTSARFAAININSGTPTATLSAGTAGGAYLNATGTLATTAKQTLTLGDTNTGEVQLTPGGTLALTARGANLIGAGTLTGLTGLTSSGTITFSGLSTNGPVYTTAGGVLNSEAQLALGRGGTNANLTAAAGAIAYSTSTALALTAAGTSGQCLTSAGTGTPVWIGCALGNATNFWTSTNGALYPINSTLDLLIGGTASTSAKFAVLNVNSGTPTASVSAGAAGAAYLTAGGNLQSTAMQSLTLGGSATGDILLTPGGTLALTARSNNLIGAGTLTGLTGLTSSGTITFSAFTSNGGPLYTNGSGVLSQVTAGTTTQVLHGGTTPSFSAVSLTADVSGILPTANGGSFWNSSSGALYPGNSTLDLLIGATSTASAKFGFINVNSGTATATISGNIVLDAAGTIQTTKNQLLTIGGNTTGGITLSPNNGSSGILNLNPGSSGNLQINGTNGATVTASCVTTTLGIVTASGSCPAGASGNNWWTLDTANGVLYPGNLTVDTLFGGNSSASAKFRVTGNAAFAGTTSVASVSALTSFAGLVVDNSGVGDLFVASKSGATKFVVLNNGNLQLAGQTNFLTTLSSAATAARTITFPDSTGTICLSVANCSFDGFWNSSSGALYPGNSTLDLLVGATASTSANFRVTGNAAFAGTTSVASVSARSSFAGLVVDNTIGDLFTASSSGVTQFVIQNNGAVGIGANIPLAQLDVRGAATVSGNLTLAGAARSIQTTANNALTLGGASTGNIILSPLNGASTGRVRINAGSVDFSGQAIAFLLATSSTNALRLNDNSGNTFFNLNTALGTSGVSAFLFSPPNTGAITSAATADYTTLTVTPPTVQLSGTTTVTSIMDSTLYNQPTIGCSSCGGGLTVNDADNVTIGGGVISSTSTTVTITNSSALRIIAGSSLDPGSGTVTNGYGLYVDAPTGAVNNYAATFATGNVGIGNTAPLTALDVTGSASLSANLSLRSAATAHTFNILDNGTLNFQRSPGGDAGVISVLYLGSNGNVGIGSATPGNKLFVTDSTTATSAAMITNSDSSATNSVLALKDGATTPGTGNRYINFLGGNGDILGKIRGNGTTTSVTYDTNGGDFAEYFTKADGVDFEEGDVVVLGNESSKVATKTSKPYEGKLLGIVSAHPGFSGGQEGPNKVLIGLLGQVPVKVTAENGAIEAGDSLTSSTLPGVAMKATKVGQIVGRALEAFNSDGIGKILAYVSVSWYDPSVYITDSGNLSSGILPIPNTTNNTIEASSSAQTTFDLASDPLFKDITDKVSLLETKIDSLSQTVAINASASAILGVSTSVLPEAKDLDLQSATISGSLMVLGRTTLTDLGVTGNINAGLLSLHGLDTFNCHSRESGNPILGQAENDKECSGATINTVGDLYLQNNLLGGINILNGKITIDTKGNLIAQGEITAKKINIDTKDKESAALGSGVVVSGKTSVGIYSTAITENSKIFVTATSPTGKQSLFVKEKNKGVGFTVAIEEPYVQDIAFDWWIVN